MLSIRYRLYNALFDTSFVFRLINTLPHDAQIFDESNDLPNLSARYGPNNSCARYETTKPKIK